MHIKSKKVWLTVIIVVLGLIVLVVLQNHNQSTQNAIPYTEAPKHIGQHITVSGKIVSTSYRKGTDFLDYCANYLNCPLALVVLDNNTSKFGDIGRYSGNNVIANGTVTTYQGRTEIIMSDPSQIRLAQ